MSEVYFDASGSAIMAVANIPNDARLRGKRVALVAKASLDVVVWTCKTVDVPARYMPSRCRSMPSQPTVAPER